MASVPSSIPSPIPHLGDGEYIPFGDDEQYQLGRRESDGKLIVETVNGSLEIDENLNVVIPGDLSVQGQTTEVDNVLTTDVFLENSSGTDQIHISGDTSPHFIEDLVGGMELRFGDGGFITYPDDAGAEVL
ncbi:MAG: hypothetical protein ABEJ72_00180, partial [Candidatus Aenigmatarchaeota archaeon]